MNAALRPRLAHLADGGDGKLQERGDIRDRRHPTARVSRFLGEGDIALGILDRPQFSENSVTGTERMKRDMAISHSLYGSATERVDTQSAATFLVGRICSTT